VLGVDASTVITLTTSYSCVTVVSDACLTEDWAVGIRVDHNTLNGYLEFCFTGNPAGYSLMTKVCSPGVSSEGFLSHLNTTRLVSGSVLTIRRSGAFIVYSINGIQIGTPQLAPSPLPPLRVMMPYQGQHLSIVHPQ
jgi:hypothetical protein